MFLVNIRVVRHCGAFQSLRSLHATAMGCGAPVSACCFRGVGLNQLHGARRSLINMNIKTMMYFSKQTQSYYPPTRCLSTSSHSEDGDLIYTGSLGTAVRAVKLFSYSTSGISLILMPQILMKTGLGVQSLALQVAFCGVIGLFTFLTPFLLHFFTKGYVVRLYHNLESDTYTAVTYNVFLAQKKIVFQQKQVRIPEVSKMFTTFYADKTGLLVNPDLFSVPQDFNHLMGYDKPFSFDTEVDRPDKS